MKIKNIALAVAAIGMVSAVASVSAGELANEFGGNMTTGNTKMESGGTTTKYTSTSGVLYGGHFFTPQAEAVGSLFAAVSSGSKLYIYSIGGNYYFTPVGKKGSVAPYVGALVGAVNMDLGGATGSGSSFAMQAGLKYYVTDAAALDVKFVHDKQDYTINSSKTKITADNIMIGASILF